MLYLKRKSDGKEFPIILYRYYSTTKIAVEFANNEGKLGYIYLPKSDYELIFKP